MQCSRRGTSTSVTGSSNRRRQDARQIKRCRSPGHGPPSLDVGVHVGARHLQRDRSGEQVALDHLARYGHGVLGTRVVQEGRPHHDVHRWERLRGTDADDVVRRVHPHRVPAPAVWPEQEGTGVLAELHDDGLALGGCVVLQRAQDGEQPIAEDALRGDVHAVEPSGQHSHPSHRAPLARVETSP